ncbi:hypothetical protein [Flavisolibacter tropicus]|uniref:Uncharacterized protein n=1 Tax=Flavisolibacter tropicus TaxID=1492898 RepID=A0A172TZT7_9BACT|nr:hypothetical protein [Flavisolibacter tropicus]ANE52619.1 hypothetical protein SY85_21185 [Flavisolibacter tropicus]
MQHYLLFQVGNSRQRIYQCQYALLQYLAIYNLKPPSDIGILLYTESPSEFEAYTSFFPAFLMHQTPITPRATILQQALQEHPGNILYCDTDVYPIKSLTSLFHTIEKGKPFLLLKQWQKEPSLVKTLLDEYEKKIRGRKTLAEKETLFQLAVVGVNLGHKPLLEKAASLIHTPVTDTSFEQVESWAFQEAFEKGNTSWSSFATYQTSTAFKELLPVFFQRNAEESIPNLVKLVHHLDAQQIQEEEERYHQQAFYKKWMDKFTGKGWSIERYKKRF